MKAIVYEKYGPPEVLHTAEIPAPQPKKNEVLIEVKASTVTSGVCWIRQGKFPGSRFFTLMIRLMFGITGPRKKVLGFEFSGVVKEIGGSVTLFRPGDRVFGTTTGLSQGAYAEFLSVPERWKMGVIATMPKNADFEQAAAIPIGGMTALYLLQKAGIASGQQVLIHGASGSVGSAVMQLACHFGATVTAVTSGKNAALVKSLGATRVIDYTREDFAVTGSYDLIFDAAGKITKAQCRTILKPGGKFASVQSLTKEKTENLIFLKELFEAGKFKPAIEKVFPWQDIVAAHHLADSGHKAGNVVVKVG